MLAFIIFGKIKAEGDGYAKSWKRARLEVAKKRLPGWQEAFMASRIEGYVKLLSDETKLASDRFWQLDKMIKEDRKKSGVIAEMSHLDKDLILLNLLREGTITESDLEGFSEELTETVRYFYKKLNGRKK